MSKGILVKSDEIGISVYIYIFKITRTSIMQKNKASSEPNKCRNRREPNHAPSISFLRSSKHPVPERRRKKRASPTPCAMSAILAMHCPPNQKKARALPFSASAPVTKPWVLVMPQGKARAKSTLVQTISCTSRTPTSPSSPHPRHPPLHGRSRPRSRDSSS